MITATKLIGVTPTEGYDGNVFRIDPSQEVNGIKFDHVTTSFGLEILHEEGEDRFAVFPSDALGRFLTLNALYAYPEGPDWCVPLRELTLSDKWVVNVHLQQSHSP